MNTQESLLRGLPVAHLLRSGEHGPSLRGSRCEACGEMFFPVSANCTACCGSDMSECELGSQGVLWSWTVQSFQPKSPYNGGELEHEFRPYGVGYVEMPGGVKVESRLTLADPQHLRIGMPMELCVVPYGRSPDGTTLHTFAFAPAGEA